MYESSHEFTTDEISLIERSGLTIAKLNDFWSRFPDLNLDVAIGGANAEIAAKEKGLTPGLEASHEANPDATEPVESGPEATSEASEEESGFTEDGGVED